MAVGSHSIDNGMMFSTYDSGHDNANSRCSPTHGGGWWYNNCGLCNMNGYSAGFYKWLACPYGGQLVQSLMMTKVN